MARPRSAHGGCDRRHRQRNRRGDHWPPARGGWRGGGLPPLRSRRSAFFGWTPAPGRRVQIRHRHERRTGDAHAAFRGHGRAPDYGAGGLYHRPGSAHGGSGRGSGGRASPRYARRRPLAAGNLFLYARRDAVHDGQPHDRRHAAGPTEALDAACRRPALRHGRQGAGSGLDRGKGDRLADGARTYRRRFRQPPAPRHATAIRPDGDLCRN